MIWGSEQGGRIYFYSSTPKRQLAELILATRDEGRGADLSGGGRFGILLCFQLLLFSLYIEEDYAVDYAVVKRVLLGTKEEFITKELTGCVRRRANSVLQGMCSNICFKLAV